MVVRISCKYDEDSLNLILKAVCLKSESLFILMSQTRADIFSFTPITELLL